MASIAVDFVYGMSAMREGFDCAENVALKIPPNNNYEISNTTICVCGWYDR